MSLTADNKKLDEIFYNKEELRKFLFEYQKKIDSLERSNKELEEKLKLMNEKHELFKEFLYKTASTQTYLSFEPEKSLINNVFQRTDHTCNINNTELSLFFEKLRDGFISERDSDYYYDSKSNTYFIKSTGWYYYPDNEAFFNPNDQRYYKYDNSVKQIKFWCNLDGSTKNSSEIEEGEIDDSEDNNDNSNIAFIAHTQTDSDQPKRDIDKFIFKCKPILHRNQKFAVDDKNEKKIDKSNSVNHIGPCRLVVKQSSTIDIGSLLIISCMGGKIGQHSNCTVTIPDRTISQIHAEINYDQTRKIYTIQDLISRNGTFVNGKKLGQLERNPLLHGDEIQLAECCKLIVHIHKNSDNNCSECDPSLTDSKSISSIYDNYKFKSPKHTMKNIKRKYGLDDNLYINAKEIDGSKLYRDRAAERQRSVGSDCPYEKTAANSGLDVPINHNNKGFQLLQKMGWNSGESLGKAASNGILAPIDVDVDLQDQRHGLGYRHE